MTVAQDILDTIREDTPLGLETLTQQWECRDPWLWQHHEELYVGFGKKAIALGQAILAFDILNEGQGHFPHSNQIIYFAALALARGGSTGHATKLLRPLLTTLDHHDPLLIEALSLAGRIAKDQWGKLPVGPQKQCLGQEAADWYAQAYTISGGDYFPGINAATMRVLTGQTDVGQQLARAVRGHCLKLQDNSAEPSYWVAATLGEAALLLGEQQEAARWYEQAVQRAGKRLGDIASFRRQVHLLATTLAVDPAVLAVLQSQKVAVFAGHMLDAPGRTEPRFPPALEGEVRQALMQAIARHNIGIGYASAACGADLLFLESLLASGAEAHVTLPFRQEDFLHTSVIFAGPEWVERFYNALRKAATVRYAANEIYIGDNILFDYCNKVMHGTAQLHAERLGATSIGLAVCDPGAGGEVGGTLAAVEAWRQLGREVEVIDLAPLRQALVTPPPAVATVPTTLMSAQLPGAAALHLPREIKTMLFSDMVGFSKLTEDSAPSFVVHFLGEVARIISSMTPRPVFKNTWGDGLFLVFDDVAAGADFALRLRHRVHHTSWQTLGLPADTNIRIGVHAGPVFPGIDPILNQQNFFGSHVNMAARIEPITPPGAVYVSEQFAALLVTSAAPGLTCDYMGNLALAKCFGTYPIYRLRHSDEIE